MNSENGKLTNVGSPVSVPSSSGTGRQKSLIRRGAGSVKQSSPAGSRGSRVSGKARPKSAMPENINITNDGGCGSLHNQQGGGGIPSPITPPGSPFIPTSPVFSTTGGGGGNDDGGSPRPSCYTSSSAEEKSFVLTLLDFMPLFTGFLLLIAGIAGIQFYINSSDRTYSNWKDISSILAGIGGGIVAQQMVSVIRKYMSNTNSYTDYTFILMFGVVVIIIASLLSSILSLADYLKDFKTSNEAIDYAELIEVITYGLFGFISGFTLSLAFSYFESFSKLFLLQASIILYSIMVLSAAFIAIYIYALSDSDQTDWMFITVGVIMGAIFSIAITFVPTLLKTPLDSMSPVA